MLQPKRTKYRKAHKGRIHGVAKGGTTLNFGAFGLKAVDPGRITARQIEAARRTITRHIRRVGRVWIRIFPDVPVSSKPAEVRMGSGKGSPEFWVCRVKPGDKLQAGERYGLIRFGSRTDLVVPKGTEMRVKAGDRVRGGETVMGVLR